MNPPPICPAAALIVPPITAPIGAIAGDPGKSASAGAPVAHIACGIPAAVYCPCTKPVNAPITQASAAKSAAT